MNDYPRIGVVFCAYGIPEYVEQSIKPWVELKKEYPVFIAAVHGQFKEYHEMGIEDNDKETQLILLDKLHKGDIDYVYIQNAPNNPNKIYQTEAQIRDKGVQWLLEQKVDYIWLWDLDEETTVEEIKKAINFIQKNDLIAWFRTYYKNLVFDEKHYIDFCPPRIFKVNYDNIYKFKRIIYDNDAEYHGIITRDILSYQQLPALTIPRSIFNPVHFSWLNNERSHQKILYAEKRWSPPNGNGCSFKWENGHLQFNAEYYKRIGQPIPEVFTIDKDYSS